MNKRKRNLTVLLTAMFLLVVFLCACMAEEKPEETQNVVPQTTSSGYGFDDWEDVSGEGTGTQEAQTQPTQSAENESTTEGTTVATESTQSTAPTNQHAPGTLSYEEFMALDPQQQNAYALSFASVEEYVSWFNSVKPETEDDNVIEIDGPVDLGQLAGNAG